MSPSAILLNGYSPASVDQEIRRSSIESDLADLRRRIAEIDNDDDNREADVVTNVGAVALNDEILEQLTNESIPSEQSVSDDRDGSEEYPAASEASAASGISDVGTDIKIDLEDLPSDVVDVLRQALSGISSAEKVNAGIDCPVE